MIKPTIGFSVLWLSLCCGLFSQAHGATSLVVLAAPSISGDESQDKAIFDYLVRFTNSIDAQQDVVVLASGDALIQLQQRLPPRVLIDQSLVTHYLSDIAPIGDDPIRLFNPTITGGMSSYGLRQEAQQTLRHYSRELGGRMQLTDLKLSHAQWQSNGVDIAILTEQILKENHLDESQARAIFPELLGVHKLIFITGLSSMRLDAALTWIGSDLLLVNAYNEPFRSQLLKQLRPLAGSVQIVEVGEFIAAQSDSMCGRYSGALLTEQALYLPVFSREEEAKMLKVLTSYLNKPVIPVNSETVCEQGIAPARLAWLVKGELAKRLQQQTLDPLSLLPE